nr:unnamed protein product [Callosobruchus chinensis]
MLLFEKNLTNCLQIPIHIQEIKVIKLDAENWMSIIPGRTVASYQCGKNQAKIPLQGTYLLEIYQNCGMHMGHSIIKGYRNPKSNFKKLALPKAVSGGLSQIQSATLEPIRLESINLEGVNNIGTALGLQKEKLQEISSDPVDLPSVSIWTIFLYVLVVAVRSYLIIKIYLKKKEDRKKKENKKPEIII